jgi:hypothetical protein
MGNGLELRHLNHLSHGAPPKTPAPATILRHCRCSDCEHWSDVRGACGVLPFTRFIPRDDVPALIRRFWTDAGMVDPREWHYCACYHGPQVSKDVWVWPRRSHHVCAGSNISREVEQPHEDVPALQGGAECQTGQGGQGRIGTPPACVAADGVGNSRPRSFCLLR